jgi:MFS family permease
MRYLTRTVWLLSAISLFTDMASELLYPIMPMYLRSIGYSMVVIGFLEGIAEAVAGLSKGYFGRWSDLSGRRVPFVQLGYALSALSKPLLVVWPQVGWVLGIRTLDRLGKGIRNGARDALLSDAATPDTKARVFGFHRAMDTLGAVLGPLLALIYLHYHPERYCDLFLWALLPGLLAIGAAALLKESAAPSNRSTKKPRWADMRVFWRNSPPPYRQTVVRFCVFTLLNSSDVFLLLRAREAGLSDTEVIGVYIFYNLVYAVSAWPLGMFADRWGMRRTWLLGLLCFCITYIGLAFTQQMAWMVVLFAVYGLYAAATEGIAKAWITNLVEREQTATAVGTFQALQSVAALLASAWAGLLWYWGGSTVALLWSGVGVLVLWGVWLRQS